MWNKLKDILVPFLIIVFAFGVWQFIITHKDLYQERKNLKQAQLQIQKEQNEKNDLKLRIASLTGELETAQARIQQVNEQLVAVKNDNAALLAAKQELEQKTIALTKEKDILQARLHSIPELKKAIREVVIDMRNQVVQEFLARKTRQKEVDAQQLKDGNGGYLVKGGRPTYKAIVKIEVRPGD